MTTETEFQMMMDMMRRNQRPSLPVNGVLSAAVASAKDGKMDIGDLIVDIGIGVTFIGIGAFAGIGALIRGENWLVAKSITGDFLRLGMPITAAKLIFDATNINLAELWSETWGQFLDFYDRRHPTREPERPMIINHRNIAKRTKSVIMKPEYSFPGGGSVSIEKLERFLLGAIEIDKWSRDYWCNSDKNRMAPGVGLLTKSQWYGIKELCRSLWGTNDRMAIMELIEDIKANIQ